MAITPQLVTIFATTISGREAALVLTIVLVVVGILARLLISSRRPRA
ncbi:MAG TPA: hypothetical protein VET26_03900 [Candidatus Sulfotelmatobacter sp.]|nr:hypothetical protein [Candidatus Sulfotelmatobacter sp.]